MTDTTQLPPHTITINDHPEPHIMQWSDLELAAIKKYAESYALQAIAQATQADVTDGIRPEDFTVDVVVKSMGGFAPVNTQGVRVTHKPTGISVTCDVARSQHTNRHQAFEKLRAILALRHERVPMTDEQADALATEAFGEYMCDLNDDIEIALVRKVEAYHRIQAKKEQA